MRKKVLLTWLTFGLVLSLSILSTPTLGQTPTSDKPIVIRGLVPFPIATDPYVPTVREFLKRVNERSKGKLKIELQGGPEIIPTFDQPDALRKGVIDMLIWIPASYAKPLVPEVLAYELSEISAWEARKSGANALWDEIFQKKLNAKYLGRLWGLVPYNIYSNKKVEKIEDFKGLIIRTMPLYVPFIKALGASPMTQPPSEVYTALERHTVDGFMFLQFGISAFSWQEVTKYRIDPGVFEVGGATFMNLNVWNKIPKDLQDIINDVMADFEYIGAAQIVLMAKREWDVLAKAGMSVISLPPKDAKKFYETAYNTTWETVIKDAPETGPKLRKLISKGM